MTREREWEKWKGGKGLDYSIEGEHLF